MSLFLLAEMIKKIINLRSKTITFSAGLIAFSTGISALLGLLRDRLLVSYFPVSKLDIYFAAFSIPNFIYGVLITGGVIAAFLPVFTETIEKNKENGWELANNALNALLLILFFFCGILFIFAPFIVKIIAPGFPAEYLKETILLTRIMLLSPILLGASSLFSGVLQYFDRFLAYSLAPIFYNIGIIFGILFLAPKFGISGVAYGVILGSFFHLLIQLPPSLFSGFSYKLKLNLKQKELKNILQLVIPRIVGQTASMINAVVITALASLLCAGSIAIFNLANHLQAVPVRVVGVAFAVAAFPLFSRSLAQKEEEKFFESFSLVIRQTLFFIIPISILVFLLRAQIVRLVLGAEGFGWRETQLTAASLGIFTFAFFAGALIHILVRVFFSFQDTKTPVIASLISMISNIILCFFFVWVLGFNNFFHNIVANFLKISAITNIEVVAFPLALFTSTIIHFLLLIYFLKKRVGFFHGLGLRNCLKKTLISSFIMANAMFFTMRFIGSNIKLNTFWAVFFQTSVASLVALIVYFFVSKIIKSVELEEVFGGFWKSSKEKELS